MTFALVTFVFGAMEDIKSQQAEKEHLMVSVGDNSVMLPAQQVDKIFHAFFMVSIVETPGRHLRADNSPRGAGVCFALPTSVEAYK
jgi:signal transduction histidine kinase